MKNLLIIRLIFSFIEPSLNIFFRLLWLAIEDLYNDGAIGSDGSICQALCDFCIRIDRSVGWEDSFITIDGV